MEGPPSLKWRALKCARSCGLPPAIETMTNGYPACASHCSGFSAPPACRSRKITSQVGTA
jgi:hypothetical protein